MTSASSPTIFPADIINQHQYAWRRRRPRRPEAAPRRPGPPGSLPAGSALAKGLAGIGRPGSARARRRGRGLADDPAPRKRRPKEGRAGSGSRCRRQARCRPPALILFSWFYKSTSIHPAAPKAPQAGSRRPSARTTRVSARRISAGKRAGRDWAPGVRQGQDCKYYSNVLLLYRACDVISFSSMAEMSPCDIFKKNSFAKSKLLFSCSVESVF